MGHRHETTKGWHARPRKGRKIGLREGAGQLASTVGAEVGKYQAVPVFYPGCLALGQDGGGGHKFIRFAACIGRRQRGGGIAGHLLRRTVDDEFVGFGGSIPALVAVHGEVAAHDGGNSSQPDRRAFTLDER